MLCQIMNGTVSPGGKTVLSHIDFEIRGTEKIGLVGENGAGKTTLLRLLSGELSLDRDDRRRGPGVSFSRSCRVDIMRQQPFDDLSRTVEEEFMAAFLRAFPKRLPRAVREAGRKANRGGERETGQGGNQGTILGAGQGMNQGEVLEAARGEVLEAWDEERFIYKREWDDAFTRFGFSKKDRKKRLSSFSGGEQTKIALIRLLLEKPDILLLDEPTNHLDVETTAWLEEYLRSYEKAVVMVSHDRFFLDRTAEVIYELTGGTLTRYAGNYTEFRELKRKRLHLQIKAYERQQDELKRLYGMVERFKHKPKKASFARAKKKAMDRLERVEKPKEDGGHIFTGELSPLVLGSKRVFEAEQLKIGYERPLLEISLRIGRGQKIGILGSNGSGKTTFLKTVAGLIAPLGGRFNLGLNVVMGYFDQHSAEVSSPKTVAGHFQDLFPAMTGEEARSVLGAFLFSGREAMALVDSLSGGEKARLLLAELLESRPNFLILDEPTNHMDIRARETLEAAFKAYTGTLLFASHDRYFLKEVADALLIFEDHSVFYYPFGYDHYAERQRKEQGKGGLVARRMAKEQALIDGLRSVPKAERYRIREVSTEEAYLDWSLQPFKERMKTAKELAGESFRRLLEAEKEWRESEEFWRDTKGSGEKGSGEKEGDGRENLCQAPCQELRERFCEADGIWLESCIKWYDVWLWEEEGGERGMRR